MVVSFVNAKGGVGKTTLAVHYAAWLHERGLDVCLVDSDSQGLSSSWIKKAVPGFAVQKLDTQQDVLKEMNRISASADVVVVDGPAGDSDLTRAILLKTDIAFLPCGASHLDITGTRQEIDVVKQAQDIRNGMPEAYFIPNKIDPKQRLGRELLEVGERIGIPFTRHHVRLRAPYADAPGQGTVVWQMVTGKHAEKEIRRLFDEIVNYGQKEVTLGKR